MKQTSLTWLIAKLIFWLTLLVAAFLVKCYYNYEVGKSLSELISK